MAANDLVFCKTTCRIESALTLNCTPKEFPWVRLRVERQMMAHDVNIQVSRYGS
jgi:hypothetical protein